MAKRIFAIDKFVHTKYAAITCKKLLMSKVRNSWLTDFEEIMCPGQAFEL